MQFPDADSMPGRVRFSHSRVAAGVPFEPLDEAFLAPEAGDPAGRAALTQLHHVFQLGRDVPVVHQFLRAVLVGHLAPTRSAGELLQLPRSEAVPGRSSRYRFHVGNRSNVSAQHFRKI